MAKVYVNLHPTYTYSNVIIGEGYIGFLKDYVRNVDWLMWDRVKRGKPMLIVSGDLGDNGAVRQHIERAEVLLQRILQDNSFEKHEILVRDERSDEWQDYVASKMYSEAEMQEIEGQRCRSEK